MIVEKHRRAEGAEGVEGVEDDGFDRAALLDALFKMPLPPAPHKDGDTRGNRPYPNHTPLGRIMALRRLRIKDIYSIPGGPSHSALTTYLSGEREMPEEKKRVVAEALGIDVRLL